MSKQVLLLLLGLLLVTSVWGKDKKKPANEVVEDKDDEVDNTDEETAQDDTEGPSDDVDPNEVYVDYVMACSRGLLQGFTQGFYNTPKFTLSKNCMDATFDSDISILYE